MDNPLRGPSQANLGFIHGTDRTLILTLGNHVHCGLILFYHTQWRARFNAYILPEVTAPLYQHRIYRNILSGTSYKVCTLHSRYTIYSIEDLRLWSGPREKPYVHADRNLIHNRYRYYWRGRPWKQGNLQLYIASVTNGPIDGRPFPIYWEPALTLCGFTVLRYTFIYKILEIYSMDNLLGRPGQANLGFLHGTDWTLIYIKQRPSYHIHWYLLSYPVTNQIYCNYILLEVIAPLYQPYIYISVTSNMDCTLHSEHIYIYYYICSIYSQRIWYYDGLRENHMYLARYRLQLGHIPITTHIIVHGKIVLDPS